MATNDDFDFPKDISDLLGNARESTTPSATVAQRVWEKTSAEIASRPGGGGGGGGSAIPGGAVALSTLASNAVRLAALTGFALGMIGGGALVHTLRPDPIPAPTPIAAASSKTVIPYAVPVIVTETVQVPGKSVEIPGFQIALNEMELVQRARIALEKRDADAAELALIAAATKYPVGQFVQERNALIIETLVLRGNVDAANAALMIFKRDYPKSPFTSGLEASIAGAGKSAD